MILLLLLLLIFAAWYNYEKRKSERLMRKNTEHFWDIERKANDIRKKDISSLDYIKLPISLIEVSTIKRLTNLQNELKTLSTIKMLNLNAFTNTELKLKYGPANLDFLSECDKNYLLLIRLLQEYASLLYEENLKDEAKNILEFSLSTGCDMKSSYKLLASIYKDEGLISKIDNLILQANNLPPLIKPSVIEVLKDLR